MRRRLTTFAHDGCFGAAAWTGSTAYRIVQLALDLTHCTSPRQWQAASDRCMSVYCILLLLLYGKIRAISQVCEERLNAPPPPLSLARSRWWCVCVCVVSEKESVLCGCWQLVALAHSAHSLSLSRARTFSTQSLYKTLSRRLVLVVGGGGAVSIGGVTCSPNSDRQSVAAAAVRRPPTRTIHS